MSSPKETKDEKEPKKIKLVSDGYSVSVASISDALAFHEKAITTLLSGVPKEMKFVNNPKK